MKFQNKYRIESARLANYDYSQSGAYFITICSKNRKCIFSNIIENRIEINEIGELVLKVWYNLPNYYPNLELDEIVIMPNHIHFIIIINDKNENIKKYSISEVVGNLKSFATRNIRTFLDDSKFEVWQSRFYDRIIINEIELLNVRNYIECNPLKWNEDEYYNP